MDSKETRATTIVRRYRDDKSLALGSPSEDAVVNVQPETASDDGVIDNALEKPILRDDWQTFKNVDTAGEYNSAIPAAPVVEASLSFGPAVIAVTALPEPSIEIATQLPIINKRRVPNSVVQDVNVGHEILVVNKSFTIILPDQPEAQEPVVAGLVYAFFKARFGEFGIPATKDNAAEPSLEMAITVKGSDHVPGTVSQGRVATMSMDVNETGVASFAPSLDLRRTTSITEDAEVLANLGETPFSQYHLADNPDHSQNSSA